jgi:protein-S-isoprenylcysteine O-methyltransferase Ste14/pimeloyl-ACP methyl ester carboxylesterase
MRRAIVAFAALPGIVAYAIPLLLVWSGFRAGGFRAIGLVPLLAGTALLLWCVSQFHRTGRGTLAPWDPPRRLVTSGPYRLSRNPMYVAVTLVLLGWAIGFRSQLLLVYAAVVAIAFHLRVLLGEEPWLARTHRDEWTRYAARVPRWIFPTRRHLALTGLAILVILPLAGMVYETLADASVAREFPPPGTLIDVGGRRLHLLCIGEGSPVVLFESSGWGSALSSPAARQRIAGRARVCSYDRRGSGWSDAAPGAASAGVLARDLAVLQDRARLPSPIVVVAASIGGLTAEMFARQFPERVAGLVFVDAASSETLALLTARSGVVTALACTAGALAHVGVMRMLDPFDIGGDSEEQRQAAGITYHARTFDQVCAVARGLKDTEQEFAAVRPLAATIPVVVLSASSAADLLPPGFASTAEEIRPAMLEGHKRLAAASHGTWAMVPDSTHLIGASQPDAVADAVLDLLESLR